MLLEDSPVTTVMLALARRGINWSGKPQERYQGVLKIVGDRLGPSYSGAQTELESA